jgi:tRNA modification GTPase
MRSETLHHDEDPIVALASGQGSSAIAILRISGKACHKALLSCLRKKNLKKPWEINYQTLCDLQTVDGVTLDEVMVTLFRAPHSYTGQDAAEIFVHGSPFIIQSALKLFYSLGFRHAEPGEFTRRAYLSGKIDLSEAEGIHGLISSCSEQQWLAARQLYTGVLKNLVDKISKELIESMAWLEASIDFPEEDDTSQIQRDQILVRVKAVEKSLEDLLGTYSNGKIATEGLSVAFFGEPNVGKSTLMNTFLQSERAIVTDIPGTTRDYLEESCLIHGRLIKFVDTAGVRGHADLIEKMGIERTYEFAKNADLVLFLSDSLSEDRIQTWIQETNPRQFLKILTKADLQPSQNIHLDWISISCHTGEGLQTLKNKIQAIADTYIHPIQEKPFISSIRHKEAVKRTLETLRAFFKAFDEGAYDEILAFELQQARKELRSIVGDISTDDILDVVFSSFCVGK